MNRDMHVQCAIAGGGPAGVMLGYLLARAGVEVAVLEKWPDFFRDFRGDTIHPSTMELLSELGLLDAFLKLPHQETKKIAVHIGGTEIPVADFTHLHVPCPFVGFIPQWDLLNFLAKQGKRYAGFHLLMKTEVTDLLWEKDAVTGLRATDEKGSFIVYADLTVGADGRHSVVREKARLPVDDLGAPIDVLWFRVPRTGGHASESLGYADRGQVLVLLNRDTYWQCALLIKKDDFPRMRKEGLAAFRSAIVGLVPSLADNVSAIRDWKDVKLLSVTVDHLRQWWKQGLLCIGDSAHAMSPVGGVGINLAIQDAVAAANILIPAFKRAGGVQFNDLRAVQKRRAWPARVIQRGQVFIHARILTPALMYHHRFRVPWQLRLFSWFPILQRAPAFIVGIGVRPEHLSQRARRFFIDGRIEK